MQYIAASLVVTLKEQTNSVDSFLDSVLGQSYYPEEMVISTGSSVNGMQPCLERFQKQAPFPVVLLDLRGANTAVQRNRAIERARFPVIAVCDADCILDARWLREITAPLDIPGAEVVAGRYQPQVHTCWQQCVAGMTISETPYLNKFLPSSRSIAFTKSVWAKVGGYPEWLDYGEERFFDLALKRKGCTFVLAPDAFVYREQPHSVAALWIEYFQRSRGDGQARIFSGMYLKIAGRLLFAAAVILGPTIVSIMLAPAAAAVLTILTWRKARRRLPFARVSAWLWAPIVAVTAALAQLSGFILGTLEQKQGIKDVWEQGQ